MNEQDHAKATTTSSPEQVATPPVETAAAGNGDAEGIAVTESGHVIDSGDGVQHAGGPTAADEEAAHHEDAGSSGQVVDGGLEGEASKEEVASGLSEEEIRANFDRARVAGDGLDDPDVVDASLDPAELEHLADDRNPGPLPPSVNAADPLHAMTELPDSDPRYVRWLEGLVSHYRTHTAELRALCNRVGAGTPDLPHYPDYVAE